MNVACFLLWLNMGIKWDKFFLSICTRIKPAILAIPDGCGYGYEYDFMLPGGYGYGYGY